MFRYDRDSELTGEALSEFIALHEVDKLRYQELLNQYLSRPPILDMEGKEEWKPDNRVPVNFGKYLVDTFNGFFNGVPLRVSHDNDKVNEVLQEFWDRNSMDDVLNELAKTTSIYGRGYLFLYQNEQSQTEVAYNDPFDMFVIYSDEIRPSSLYGIRYTTDEDGGGYKGHLFTDTQAYTFKLKGDELSLEEDYPLFYGRIPIIEFIENEERQSLIEPVEPLINSFNKTLSEKVNDVEYFSDSYLAVLGALLDDESIKHLKDNRIINMAGDGAEKVTVEFLTKPDADATQENTLNRIERLIYQTSSVVNLNDTEFAGLGNSSGIALEMQLQPMKNLASNKERKFQSGIQTMFGMLFNVVTNVPSNLSSEYTNIKYNWSRNLPANDREEAEIARALEGIISHEEQLRGLSRISDPQIELEKIEEENALPQYDFEMSE